MKISRYLKTTASNRWTNMSRNMIPLNGECHCSNTFSLTITLDDQASKGATSESQDWACQRCGSNHHETESTSKCVLNFSEHQFVPQTILSDDTPSNLRLFRIQCHSKQHFLDGRVADFIIDFIVHSIQQSRNGGHYCWLQSLQVISQLLDIARVVANGTASVEQCVFASAFKHVGEWQEGNHYVSTSRLVFTWKLIERLVLKHIE